MVDLYMTLGLWLKHIYRLVEGSKYLYNPLNLFIYFFQNYNTRFLKNLMSANLILIINSYYNDNHIPSILLVRVSHFG